MSDLIPYSIRLLWACLVILTSCTFLPQFSRVSTPSPTPQPTVTTPVAAQPLAPTPTLTPTQTLEFMRYKQAMLPQFAADVDTAQARHVTQYNIQVTVDKASLQAKTGVQLSGVMFMDYTNNEAVALDKLYFRLYPNLPGYGGAMAVQYITIGDTTIKPQPEVQSSTLTVSLAGPLPPQTSLKIRLDYTATVPLETSQGYNIFSYNNGTLALAGFYPTMAVYDENGWNTPIPPVYGDATYSDVSLYDVYVTTPPDMVVVGSGNLLNETHYSEYKTTRFTTGPMRDFYLVMRPDFQVVSDTVDGIIVNSYYPPDLAEGGQRVLDYATDALHFYNEHFGLYPYAEFDIVATPTKAGGVEYPGVVVAAEQFYGQTGGYLQHVVGHEVAHQWWYGLVGNNQVTTPWLDEAFTNYSTLLYWRAFEGETVANRITEDFFRAPYQRAKKAGQDRPVAGSVADFTPNNYGAIVYGKGPLFFLELQQQVGEETFYKITKTYYNQYKYKIAQPDDFIAVVEQVSGQDITPLYEKWITGQ